MNAIKTSASFKFDPCDLNGIRALMNEYGDSGSAFSGKNESGEDVLISINYENIVVRTFQKNGWMRVNTYYADGDMDETFEK